LGELICISGNIELSNSLLKEHSVKLEERKINDVKLENTLNQFGVNGWELVTIIAGTNANCELSDFVAVLKREVNF
jgi:Domain of unknown function (DUF4177)